MHSCSRGAWARSSTPPATWCCRRPTWCSLTCCSYPSSAPTCCSAATTSSGAPDLVVEILSPATAGRDRTLKRALYARHGVKEYWLVDPEARTVTVLGLGAGDFDVVDIYGEGQTMASPTLSGFSAGLDEFL